MCDQIIRKLQQRIDESDSPEECPFVALDVEILEELKRLRARDVFSRVAEFNARIKEIEPPETPRRPTQEEKIWFITALEEEIKEFRFAETLAEEADGLVDLIYFALGFFMQMGIDFNHGFNEVHAANMRKIRGSLEKRGNYGHDAVKPPGWKGPDWTWLENSQ